MPSHGNNLKAAIFDMLKLWQPGFIYWQRSFTLCPEPCILGVCTCLCNLRCKNVKYVNEWRWDTLKFFFTVHHLGVPACSPGHITSKVAFKVVKLQSCLPDCNILNIGLFQDKDSTPAGLVHWNFSTFAKMLQLLNNDI